MLKRATLPPRPLPRHRRQGGFALLWGAIIVLGLGTALAVGITALEQRSAQERALAPADAMAWAEQAVTGYAALHARLPCPAASANGVEDCAISKGWLPASLLAQPTQPEAADLSRPTDRVPPIRYMVHRAAGGLDLTQASDTYQPRRADFDPAHADAAQYITGLVNRNDLCDKLQRIAPEPVGTSVAGSYWLPAPALRGPADASRAHIQRDDAQPPLLNVAFGLAYGGPGAATGRNDAPAPSLDWPGTAAAAGEVNLTRAVPFRQLSDTLGCPTTLASLDAVAVSASVMDQLVSLRQSLQEKTEYDEIMAHLKWVSRVVSTGLDAVGIALASEKIAKHTITLSAAIATCIATLGLVCFPVAIQSTALASAVVSMTTAVTGTAMGVASVGMEIDTAARYTLAKYKAARLTPDTNIDLGELTEEVCKAPANLEAKLASLIQERDQHAASIAAAHAGWEDISQFFRIREEPQPFEQLYGTYSRPGSKIGAPYQRLESVARDRAQAESAHAERESEQKEAQDTFDGLNEQMSEAEYSAIRTAMVESDTPAAEADALIAELRHVLANINNADEVEQAQQALDKANTALSNAIQRANASVVAFEQVMGDHFWERSNDGDDHWWNNSVTHWKNTCRDLNTINYYSFRFTDWTASYWWWGSPWLWTTNWRDWNKYVFVNPGDDFSPHGFSKPYVEYFYARYPIISKEYPRSHTMRLWGSSRTTINAEHPLEWACRSHYVQFYRHRLTIESADHTLRQLEKSIEQTRQDLADARQACEDMRDISAGNPLTRYNVWAHHADILPRADELNGSQAHRTLRALLSDDETP